MRASGIYAITSPSGRKYVGSAVNISQRWAVHRSELKARKHHCAPLQNAADKYGLDTLKFSVVELCARSELITREQAHIDSEDFSRLYNVTPTAGSRLGAKATPETRAKLSAFRKSFVGWSHSAETRARMSIAGQIRHKTRPLSESSRQAIAKALTGRNGAKHSPEAIEKMRTAQVGHAVSEETKRKISVANSGKKRTPEQLEKLSRAVSAAKNKSGYIGVSKSGKGAWVAYATGGVYVGTFATATEAHAERARYLADPALYTRPARRPSKRNQSGHVGVTYDKARNMWTAWAPKSKYLGRFKTIEEAVAAREAYLATMV